MTSYHERAKLIEAEKRPWSFEVAAAKARELAMKLNIPIYLVPVSGGYGQMAWDISKQSMEQREAYEEARQRELRQLHPDRYPPPLTRAEQLAADARAQDEARAAEYRRLWEHDNPGLQELYYPSNFPANFFPECD